MILSRDIARDGNCSTACFLNPLHSVGSIVFFAQIGNEDICSLASKRNCHRLADARVRAGDQGDLALKPTAALYDCSPWSGTGCIALILPGGSWCCSG